MYGNTRNYGKVSTLHDIKINECDVEKDNCMAPPWPEQADFRQIAT